VLFSLDKEGYINFIVPKYDEDQFNSPDIRYADGITLEIYADDMKISEIYDNPYETLEPPEDKTISFTIQPRTKVVTFFINKNNGIGWDATYITRFEIRKPNILSWVIFILAIIGFFVFACQIVMGYIRYDSLAYKFLVGLTILTSAGLFFLYDVYRNGLSGYDLIAPININIEINKEYQNLVAIIEEPNKRVFNLVPTDFGKNDLKQTIIHHEIIDELVQGLFIRIPVNQNNAIVESINNISIFIGNKLFYFTSSEIKSWDYSVNGEYKLYSIPLDYYSKSVIKPWINWYGDFNFVLAEVMTFITRPNMFKASWFFMMLFIFLFYRNIHKIYTILSKKHKKQIEIIVVVLLSLFAFALRINNISRYSTWMDDLWAARDSNPVLPFVTVLNIPAHPPLYYILLRIWFSIFGWTEFSGRLFSNFLVVGGIVSLYCFVKMLCGRKHACISAFLLAISFSAIGFSNQIKQYILLLAFVPLLAQQFIIFLKYQKTKNLVIYVLIGIAIVNTHFVAIFIIIGNFIFYFVFNFINMNTINIKRISSFLLANFVMALSTLYYIKMMTHFAFRTNASWIPEIGMKQLSLLFILMCLTFGFLKMRKNILIRWLNENQVLMLLYSLFIFTSIYAITFFLSLQRNILSWRYLSTCMPFIMIVLPLLIIVIHNNSKLVLSIKSYITILFNPFISLVLLISLANFISGWGLFPGAMPDVYKESQQYIERDIKNHRLPSAIIYEYDTDTFGDFYKIEKIPRYEESGQFKVVYMNPFVTGPGSTNIRYDLLSASGLDMTNILKIRTNLGKTILKKYILEERVFMEQAYEQQTSELTFDELLNQALE
jgi:uncharacterized membrane protein